MLYLYQGKVIISLLDHPRCRTVVFKSDLEKVVEDLFSHPVLESRSHHVCVEELSFLKVTTVWHWHTVLYLSIKCLLLINYLKAYSFAHFDHSLLQVNVQLEVGMSFSVPENHVGERNLRIILLHRQQQHASDNKKRPCLIADLFGHGWWWAHPRVTVYTSVKKCSEWIILLRQWAELRAEMVFHTILWQKSQWSHYEVFGYKLSLLDFFILQDTENMSMNFWVMAKCVSWTFLTNPLKEFLNYLKHFVLERIIRGSL